MTRFEYQTVDVPTMKKSRFAMPEVNREELNQTLKKLGEQGWELVSTFHTNISGSTVKMVMVFKRAVN